MMKLFIGNLSWDTDENGLRDIFEAYGEIEDLRIITDRDTGRSRGFGFITFSSQDSGLKAIEERDGAELQGRALKVNEAREREPRRQSNW